MLKSVYEEGRGKERVECIGNPLQDSNEKIILNTQQIKQVTNLCVRRHKHATL